MIKSAVREAADFFSGFYQESKVHCNCSELYRFVLGRCLYSDGITNITS